eukprot:m.59893 g.59893  ORF g.59893 m.59893 type:complete len:719 (-) comp7923_c0_seq1:1118-3274(-)
MQDRMGEGAVGSAWALLSGPSLAPIVLAIVAVIVPRLLGMSRRDETGMLGTPVVSLDIVDLIMFTAIVLGTAYVHGMVSNTGPDDHNGGHTDANGSVATTTPPRHDDDDPTTTTLTPAATGADADSTYGTVNDKVPNGASPSLGAAVSEAQAASTPSPRREPGSMPMGESDIDEVLRDLEGVVQRADGATQSELGVVVRRLKDVVANDDFLSPRFNTMDAEDHQILQYVEGHGVGQVKLRRRGGGRAAARRERLRCRSMVDGPAVSGEEDNGASVGSPLADALMSPVAGAMLHPGSPDRAQQLLELRNGLEDSHSAGSVALKMAVQRAAVGTPPGNLDPCFEVLPQWQRGLETATLDDEELAQWGFDPFTHVKALPEAFGVDLWDDASISGVGVAMQMLSYHGLFDALELDKLSMKRYLRNVERAYPRNPYHNRVHALDVMQTCHSVLAHSPELKTTLDPIEKLALLLGAYVHDVGHPGVNNKLLMRLADDPKNSLHPDFAAMAVRYSNHSVCEYYHLATAFEIAFEGSASKANPFARLPQSRFARLRLLMIELVLATDMEQHFNLMARMKVATGAGADGGDHVMDLADPDKKLLMLKAILHACDISNPAKPEDVCQKWCVAIMEEFYRQGDLETNAGMAADKMHIRCDLTTAYGKVQKANGQLAFIKFIVRPLHELLALQLQIFKTHALVYIDANVKFWEKLKADNEAEAAEEEKNM